MELIPTYNGRPSVVKQNNCTIYLSVHDAEFLRQWRAWRLRLAAAHPDTGGTAVRFRKALVMYREWQYVQAKFYNEVGVEPPRPLPEPQNRVGATLRLPETAVCPTCGKTFIPRRSVKSPTGMTTFCKRPCSKPRRRSTVAVGLEQLKEAV
jgi:hypothetical protein